MLDKSEVKELADKAKLIFDNLYDLDLECEDLAGIPEYDGRDGIRSDFTIVMCSLEDILNKLKKLSK